MAQRLHERIERVTAKCRVLVEKYDLLCKQKSRVEEELAATTQQVAQLRLQVEQLQRENRLLKIASTLAPDGETARASRQMLTKIVRDIDKCIAQLNS